MKFDFDDFMIGIHTELYSDIQKTHIPFKDISDFFKGNEIEENISEKNDRALERRKTITRNIENAIKHFHSTIAPIFNEIMPQNTIKVEESFYYLVEEIFKVLFEDDLLKVTINDVDMITENHTTNPVILFKEYVDGNMYSFFNEVYSFLRRRFIMLLDFNENKGWHSDTNLDKNQEEWEIVHENAIKMLDFYPRSEIGHRLKFISEYAVYMDLLKTETLKNREKSTLWSWGGIEIKPGEISPELFSEYYDFRENFLTECFSYSYYVLPSISEDVVGWEDYFDQFFMIKSKVVCNISKTELLELCVSSYKLHQEIANEKQKNIDYKERVLDRHAHDWKHIVYPSIVSEVAVNLTANKDYVNAGKLFSAYNSEQMLKLDLDLLKFEFKNEDEKLVAFKKSIDFYEFSLYPTVEDIAFDALEIVLFKLIMVDEADDVQNKKSKAYNISLLKEKFINEVIVNMGKEGRENSNKKVIKKWFEDNFYSVRIQHNSLVWRDILHFINEEHTVAYTQIFKMFINLFTNLLNYGVKNNNGYIEIVFDEEIVKKIKYLTIKMSNPVDRNTAFYKSSDYGIENIKEILHVLNSKQEKKEEVEDIMVDLDAFSIKLFLSATIFE